MVDLCILYTQYTTLPQSHEIKIEIVLVQYELYCVILFYLKKNVLYFWKNKKIFIFPFNLTLAKLRLII